MLNLDELIFEAGSNDSVNSMLEPWLIVHINGSDRLSPLLHGYEPYTIMELIEQKPFVVPAKH